MDASALVAILMEEDGHTELAGKLDQASHRLWSAMSCWEAINALQRFRDFDLTLATVDVELFAENRGLVIVPIGEQERRCALEAYRTYGRGRHPARLNMGDCFAYACAKTNGAQLLYVGNDFSKTDLA